MSSRYFLIRSGREKFNPDLDHSQIETLADGEAIEVGSNAYIKRHGRYNYVLHDRDNKTRNRWGNAREIYADAVFYATHGYLPPADMGMW